MHPDDDNVLSVLYYAVNHLKVKHGQFILVLEFERRLTGPLSLVVVVGHSNCGGVAACVAAAGAPPQEPKTPLLRWLAPLTDLARSLGPNLLPEKEAISLLVEENVRKQVENLAETETIRKAQKRGEPVQLHKWIYDLSTGKLCALETLEACGK